MDKEYINAIKASVILGCSVKQVYNYLNAGKLTKYIEEKSGYTKFDKAEVEKLKDSVIKAG